jgi:hypothetical protein
VYIACVISVSVSGIDLHGCFTPSFTCFFNIRNFNIVNLISMCRKANDTVMKSAGQNIIDSDVVNTAINILVRWIIWFCTFRKWRGRYNIYFFPWIFYIYKKRKIQPCVSL